MSPTNPTKTSPDAAVIGYDPIRYAAAVMKVAAADIRGGLKDGDSGAPRILLACAFLESEAKRLPDERSAAETKADRGSTRAGDMTLLQFYTGAALQGFVANPAVVTNATSAEVGKLSVEAAKNALAALDRA